MKTQITLFSTLGIGCLAVALSFTSCKNGSDAEAATTYTDVDSAVFEPANQQLATETRLHIYPHGRKAVALGAAQLPVKVSRQDNQKFQVETQATAVPDADSMPYATGHSDDLAKFGFKMGFSVPDSCSPAAAGGGASTCGIGVVDLRDNRVLHVWEMATCALTVRWTSTHLLIANGKACHQQYLCTRPMTRTDGQ